MNTIDERDRRLAEFLDRSVRTWEPPADAGWVIRRGSRRRRLRTTAAILTVAVFVSAVGWAAVEVRRGRATALGSLATDGWTMDLPAGWRAQTITRCPSGPATIRDGAIVTNASFTFRNPQGGAPSCGDRFVFGGFPSDGVAFSIEPMGVRPGFVFRHPAGTPFPLTPRLLTPTGSIRGGASESYVPIWIGGEERGIVRRWVGPEADPTTIATLDAALASVDVAGAVHWSNRTLDTPGPGELELRLPRDWDVRSAAGSWPLLASPGVSADAGACAQGDRAGSLGGGAVVLLTPDLADAPGRPARLAWDNADLLERKVGCGREGMTRGVWRFSLAGRHLSAELALGGLFRDETTARIAWSIVESLAFTEPAGPQTPSS